VPPSGAFFSTPALTDPSHFTFRYTIFNHHSSHDTYFGSAPLASQQQEQRPDREVSFRISIIFLRLRGVQIYRQVRFFWGGLRRRDFGHLSLCFMRTTSAIGSHPLETLSSQADPDHLILWATAAQFRGTCVCCRHFTLIPVLVRRVFVILWEGRRSFWLGSSEGVLFTL
jgi:hypothetical protein